MVTSKRLQWMLTVLKTTLELKVKRQVPEKLPAQN